MDSPLQPLALNGLKEKFLQAESHLNESSETTKSEIEKIKAGLAESKSKYASITSQIADPGAIRRPSNPPNNLEQELRITQSMLENSNETIKLLNQKILSMEVAAKNEKSARNKEVTSHFDT